MPLDPQPVRKILILQPYAHICWMVIATDIHTYFQSDGNKLHNVAAHACGRVCSKTGWQRHVTSRPSGAVTVCLPEMTKLPLHQGHISICAGIQFARATIHSTLYGDAVLRQKPW